MTMLPQRCSIQSLYTSVLAIEVIKNIALLDMFNITNVFH